MSDTYRPLSDETRSMNNDPKPGTGDPGRTLLVGVLGGLVSAAGYLIYSRLPEEQRDRLHQQVRGVVETRLNEIRSNFNI